MNKIIIVLGLAISLVLLALPSGCYTDNEEDLYGPGLSNCDTAGMRFSVEIREILNQNCNACHVSTGPTYSGIPFETYAQFETVAKNGKLLDRINNQAAPMPQTGLMSLCNRAKIEAWVNAGALDN